MSRYLETLSGAKSLPLRQSANRVQVVSNDRENAVHARLEFPDGSFDRVNCSRVLLHLEDARAAVAEMARVLAPGGHLAITEPDHDAFVIDSDDLQVARAVRRHLTAGLRNPDIGRRLRRLLLDNGLEVVAISGVARPVPNLQYAINQFQLLDHLDSAVAAGDITAEAAREWRTWVEAANSSGRLFISPVHFQAFATKPLSQSDAC